MRRATHTYAILTISDSAYNEIKQALAKAGYGDAFITDSRGRELIDLDGLAAYSAAQAHYQAAYPNQQTAEADDATPKG